ncbi:hypothetical protein A2U01_0106346, partial [Trifolium medium]|nr:hypothetical protein [Trifolium medium]
YKKMSNHHCGDSHQVAPLTAVWQVDQSVVE